MQGVHRARTLALPLHTSVLINLTNLTNLTNLKSPRAYRAARSGTAAPSVTTSRSASWRATIRASRTSIPRCVRRVRAIASPQSVLAAADPSRSGVEWIKRQGDGRYFISNGKDHAIKLWDLRAMSSSTTARATPRNTGFDYRYMPDGGRVRNSTCGGWGEGGGKGRRGRRVA